MGKELEVEYVEVADYDKWATGIAGILAEGVFGLLRDKGLLRKDPSAAARVEPVLSGDSADGRRPEKREDGA